MQRQRLPASASRIASSLGVRVALEQVDRGDDHAGRAEAALHRARVEERLLHRVQRSPSPSDSTVRTIAPSACTAGTRQEQTSSPSSQTVQEPHSPCSHAFFDADEAELVAQEREQARAGPDVDLVLERR